MKIKRVKRFIFATTVLAVLAGYQNCSLSPSFEAGGSSSLVKGCETPIAQVFTKNYYPFFRQQCVGCHDNGEAGSSRAFADANVSSAFDKFMSVGRGRVEGNMVSASHKPPFTGPQNKGLVDRTASLWDAAEFKAARCAGENPFVTSPKAAPAAVYASTPADNAVWPKLSWDLDVDVAGATAPNVVHATFTLDVRRYLNASGVAIGYQFRNPVVQIKAGSPDPGYRLEQISMNLNGEDLSTFTIYSLLNVVVTGTTATNLAPNNAISAAPTATLSANADDLFAMRFASFKASSDPAGSNNGGGGVTPGAGPGASPVTFADLLSGNQTLGVFSAYCQNCHRAGNTAGSFNITNYANAFALRATIQSRMNNQANPMPPGGLLNATQRAVVDRWINAGAPEN